MSGSGGSAPGRGPRLALLGAFPFPYPQGSQVFFAEQARALIAAGARCDLLTYGRGAGADPGDLRLVRAPAWSAPRRMRSGPHWGKPLADAGLLTAWLREARGARPRHDCVLAHNVEAAWIALAARPLTRVPVVYVAHTVLRHELSAYGPRLGPRVLDPAGAAIDRSIARRVDGTIVLGEAARCELAPFARAPLEVIVPGHDASAPPTVDDVRAACARHGLPPDGFVLYSGNLDGYQELDLLSAAARHLGPAAPPVVVATHDAEAAARARRSAGTEMRFLAVDGFAEMRALTFGARVLVCTRRRAGGFPVKLLNYMEAARPIVAFAGVATGLRHGESAWLLERDDEPAHLARAIEQIVADPALARRLGAGAREQLERAHRWSRVAEHTLAFLDRVLERTEQTKAQPPRPHAACG